MFVGNNDLVGKWAPELVRVGPWVNAAPLRLRYDLADHPVLVTFFTSTDLNRVRALPVLLATMQGFRDQVPRVVYSLYPR